MQLGIEHLTGNATHVEHTLQQFRDFDRSCTNEHRTAGIAQAFDFLDYCSIFFFLGLVNTVVEVKAGDGTVCGNGHNIEFVDVPQLTSFGFGRTCHTRQLVIHAEIVLQCDSGKCLCSGFYLNTFFGFDCLVQTVAITAAFHDTACLLVNNLDFVVVDHIFNIFFKECICFEQLSHCVHTFGFHSIVLHQFVFALLTLCDVGNSFGFRKLCRDVGKHKELGVINLACQFVNTLVGEFNAAVFLIDYKVERIGHLGHFATIVLQEIGFGVEQQRFYTFLAQILDERTVFWKPFVGTEQENCTFFANVLVF